MSTTQGLRLPGPGRAPASHRVHGPSALSGDFRRFWSLTFTLARTEFKLRFFGSVLGYVWTLVRPLLLFGVLYVFFTEVAHVNNSKSPGEHFYGAQLLKFRLLVHLPPVRFGRVHLTDSPQSSQRRG